jgi:hypothetical protein
MPVDVEMAPRWLAAPAGMAPEKGKGRGISSWAPPVVVVVVMVMVMAK